jgi:membrane protein
VSARLSRILVLFYELDGFFLAGGLSFFVVVCLVPFVLLLIAGGSYLLSDEAVIDEILGRLVTTFPVYHSEMRQLLLDVVAARRLTSVVGTVVLVVFAVQLFAATRYVLNRVLGIESSSFFTGVAFDLGMMLLLAVLFFVSVGVTALLAWVRAGLRPLEGDLPLAALFGWAGLAVTVALDVALFSALYRFVPNARLPWRSVLAASVTAGLLWEVAKQLFRLYILGVGLYSAVYGSFGVAIALIMWVYYSAVVFVLGATLMRRLEEERAAAAL